METLSEERLMTILQTSSDIVLGTKPAASLTSTLMDIDEHVREALVSNLVVIFRRGMAQNLDIEAFDVEIEKLFAEKKRLSKALHAYWRKYGEELCRNYSAHCPLDARLVDLKWVTVLPSESKYGLESAEPTVQCQFTTTKEKFTLDFTPEGINQLVEDLNTIQTALQEMK